MENLSRGLQSGHSNGPASVPFHVQHPQEQLENCKHSKLEKCFTSESQQEEMTPFTQNEFLSWVQHVTVQCFVLALGREAVQGESKAARQSWKGSFHASQATLLIYVHLLQYQLAEMDG